MKKRKLLSLILAMVLACALLPAVALAAGDFQIIDGVLVGYTGPDGDVVIPNGVTNFGRLFRQWEGLTSVTIPDSVTSIDTEAFRDCKNLTSVTIPDSVTTIGEGAFRGCASLTSVTIPDSVTEISEYAFSGCDGLTSMTIPDSVTTIGECAFNGCYNLTSVTIPDSVTTIGESAFHGCKSLTSVTIPDSVTTIGVSAFHNCFSLTSVTIPDSVTSIGKAAFRHCDSLTSVTIPDSVTTIGGSAFAWCDNLTSVTIGNGVTTIPLWMFINSDDLTSVTIPASVTVIQLSAFSDTSLTDVYYGGTEDQWNAVRIEDYNRPLKRATIHYNSAPAPAETPAPALSVNTAYSSAQEVEVDGTKIVFQCYALKDVNGNDTNYIKLRDVASILNGSGVQFNVGWDGAVNIETGKAYVSNGSEMKTPFSGNRDYEIATAETRINGSPAALDAIVLKDDAGGAYTYYKLRDLGAALGFKVDWSAEKGIFIETK